MAPRVLGLVVEAYRRVGVGRKTGYRWRNERGGLPPQDLVLGTPAAPTRWITLQDRWGMTTSFGKAAVITGGDSGIGKAVAIAFAREGDDLLIATWLQNSTRALTRILVGSNMTMGLISSDRSYRGKRGTSVAYLRAVGLRYWTEAVEVLFRAGADLLGTNNAEGIAHQRVSCRTTVDLTPVSARSSRAFHGCRRLRALGRVGRGPVPRQRVGGHTAARR